MAFQAEGTETKPQRTKKTRCFQNSEQLSYDTQAFLGLCSQDAIYVSNIACH